MSSTPNLPPVNDDARGSYPVIGGRAHPDHIKVIDRACLELGTKRGLFIVDAAVEKAERALRELGIDVSAITAAA